MRLFKLLLSYLLFIAVFLFYQFKFTAIPPLGKFFDPFGGFWQNAESEDKQLDEFIDLEGLKLPVKILYDERLVPHIFAQNDHDLYFTQGYITASFRLWQMELQTHAAAGRLSEIVGEAAFNRDKESRRLGLGYGAEKALEMAMSHDTTQMILNAYADGVNAYIENLSSKNLPLEYKLLDYKPEPWSPLKTVLLLKYMSNMLTGHDNDFEMTNFLKLYGKENLEQLFPDFADTLQEPIVPIGTAFTQSEASPESPVIDMSDLIISDKQITKPEPGNGSNNWAVSGSKTDNGRPILCNDPHLSLNLPSIWFEMQMKSPNLNVYGATLPGAPGIIVGFNDSIAWGVTNGAIDVKDWYSVNIKDKSRKQYLYEGKWVDFEYRVEEIKVRGKGIIRDTVLYTNYGPVVYDINHSSGPEKNNMALRWTVHDPSNEAKVFYNLNRAFNFDDYEKALRDYDCPSQNFVFASYNNDIAIRHQGKIPNRFKDQGRFVMDGSDEDFQWKSYIPFDDLPQIKNPTRGFVSSANQHPTDNTYPYYYTGTFEYYRNRRINEQIGNMSNIKTEDMMRLQNDNFNIYASEALPIMLSYLDVSALDNSESQALTILKSWVYYNDPELPAPVYFEAWWDEFFNILWDEFDAHPSRSLEKPKIFHTIRYLQKTPEGFFTNRITTPENEKMHDLITLSYKLAVKKVEEWKTNQSKELNWANYKNTSIKHLSTLDAFSIKEVRNGGNASIVNATTPTKGPSWRMVVSPGKPVIAFGIYPGGQSGNPGSKFYDNAVDDWAKGKYYSLIMLENDDQQSGILFKQQAKPRN
jgi:penicillin amidase